MTNTHGDLGQPVDFSVRQKSSVPGRQRWVVEALRGHSGFAHRVESHFQKEAGIRSARTNPITGSLLIEFDPASPCTREWVLVHLDLALTEEPEDAGAALGNPEPPRPSVSKYWLGAAGALLLPKLLMGGAAGPVIMGAAFVGAAFVTTGGVLEFLRQEIVPPGDTTGPLQRFVDYVQPMRREFLLAATCSVIRKILDYAPPIFIGMAVNIVAGRPSFFLSLLGVTGPVAQVTVLGIVAWVVYIGESTFEYQYKARWRRIAQKVQNQLRRDAYAHAQLLELRYLEGASTGNLAVVLNENINQIQVFLDNGLNAILEIATNVMVIVAAFTVLAPGIAWISLLPIPFVAFLAVRYHSQIGPIYKSIQRKSGAISGLLVNNLSGISTIRSFGTEERELARLKSMSQDFMDMNMDANLLFSAFEPTVRLPIQTAFASLVIAGGRAVITGSIDNGAFASILFLLPRFLFPFAYFGTTIDQYQRAISAVARVFDLMDQPVGPQGGDRGLPLKKVRGAIRFDHVEFGYRPGVPVLRDFDMRVEAGQTVAIVGATGSGKTTVIKLLLRFYEFSGGRILVDGRDIRDIRVSDLRRAIGLVSQDVFLFDGTIAENIGYGSPAATVDEIHNAAAMAEASTFIDKLPDRYQTVIGERGLKLSGGQRQRLCLARAILREPPILILDEATSSLDNETEAAIQRSLAHISIGRTTIVIAHRLSTIRQADCIFVIGTDGRVNESGTHEELIRTDGIYAALWKVQTGMLERDTGKGVVDITPQQPGEA